MKAKLFPIIIALAALSVSCSAAFYSVYGLGKLFAGASTQVMIMAGSLEFAKLVIASALYQYWDSINKVLRGYLVLATFILMAITSAGIYGFLTGAYQETYASTQTIERQISLIEAKKANFDSRKLEYVYEKEQLTNSITQLRLAISNPGQTQSVDRNTGQVITNTSNSSRKLLQAEVARASDARDSVDVKIQALSDSISTADIEILTLRNSDQSVRELGPLMYISKLVNVPMDKVINWYLLLIIFVFDPLAITLVVVANQAFDKIKKQSNKSTNEDLTHTTTDDGPANEPIIITNTLMYDTESNSVDIDNTHADYSTIPPIQEPPVVNTEITGSQKPDIYQEKQKSQSSGRSSRAYWT